MKLFAAIILIMFAYCAQDLASSFTGLRAARAERLELIAR